MLLSQHQTFQEPVSRCHHPSYRLGRLRELGLNPDEQIQLSLHMERETRGHMGFESLCHHSAAVFPVLVPAALCVSLPSSICKIGTITGDYQIVRWRLGSGHEDVSIALWLGFLTSQKA